MVQFSVVPVLAVAALAAMVEAKNCKEGLSYCGSTLLRRGDYNTQIRGALATEHQATDSDHINNSLFFCDGTENGGIRFTQYCDQGCADGGEGNSDSC